MVSGGNPASLSFQIGSEYDHTGALTWQISFPQISDFRLFVGLPVDFHVMSRRDPRQLDEKRIARREGYGKTRQFRQAVYPLLLPAALRVSVSCIVPTLSWIRCALADHAKHMFHPRGRAIFASGHICSNA